jgi:transcriptional regulator GlxA family with amidase domain
MHRVAIVATDGVVPLDLSIPYGVFGWVRLRDGRAGYDVRVCGVGREVETGGFRLRTRYGLAEVRRADTVILPGTSDVDVAVPDALVRAVRKAATRGARVASICSGAFLLAATGLLDGRRATTHWLAAPALALRHPQIRVDPDVLYVDEGQGGQSQFIVHAPPSPDGASLAGVLRWLEEHLHEDLPLARIARRAAMSIRNLNRRFREQTGATPLQWVHRARVRRAQLLLETTAHSVEGVAATVGFRSVTAFREHFRRVAATSPQAYRRSFRSKPARRRPV